MTPADAALKLIEAGRYLLENGLTWGNAGNLSCRLDGERMLITASGTRLGELAEGDLVECSIAGQRPGGLPRKPSKETPMHAAVYAARPEIGAVLHASPFYATLAACSGLALPGDLFVENMYYLERVARLPYAHPGSSRLGEVVAEHVDEANVLLLENHGVLVYDTSVSEALMALHTLELTARLALTARGAGLELKGLPAEVVSDFLLRSGYRAPRRWPEAGGRA